MREILFSEHDVLRIVGAIIPLVIPAREKKSTFGFP